MMGGKGFGRKPSHGRHSRDRLLLARGRPRTRVSPGRLIQRVMVWGLAGDSTFQALARHYAQIKRARDGDIRVCADNGKIEVSYYPAIGGWGAGSRSSARSRRTRATEAAAFLRRLMTRGLAIDPKFFRIALFYRKIKEAGAGEIVISCRGTQVWVTGWNTPCLKSSSMGYRTPERPLEEILGYDPQRQPEEEQSC
jgi:hypothetical protein